MYIRELIKSIQIRPLMFVQEERLDYIEHLLMGYCGACHKSNSITEMDKNFNCWFEKWLREWIRVNYNDSYELKTLFWHDAIRDITYDENEAVQLFYKLCEQFFCEYEGKRGYFSKRD